MSNTEKMAAAVQVLVKKYEEVEIPNDVPGMEKTDPGPHPRPEGSPGRPCLHGHPRGDTAQLYQGGQLRYTLCAGCACQEPRKVYLLDYCYQQNLALLDLAINYYF